jgi:hypothetical protein
VPVAVVPSSHVIVGRDTLWNTPVMNEASDGATCTRGDDDKKNSTSDRSGKYKS